MSARIDVFCPKEPSVSAGVFYPNVPSVSAERNILEHGCVCLRPKGHVLCKNCGFVDRGRIKLSCRQHYNVRFIHDYDCCPKCLVVNMMDEF